MAKKKKKKPTNVLEQHLDSQKGKIWQMIITLQYKYIFFYVIKSHKLFISQRYMSRKMHF